MSTQNPYQDWHDAESATESDMSTIEPARYVRIAGKPFVKPDTESYVELDENAEATWEFDPSRPVSEMTDTEMLREIVHQMRTVGAALAEFQKMGPMGIMASMMGRKK